MSRLVSRVVSRGVEGDTVCDGVKGVKGGCRGCRGWVSRVSRVVSSMGVEAQGQSLSWCVKPRCLGGVEASVFLSQSDHNTQQQHTFLSRRFSDGPQFSIMTALLSAVSAASIVSRLQTIRKQY